MKLSRFFGLIPVLFVLVLLFSACDTAPITGGGGSTSSNNGTVYYGQTSNTQYVFLSIYSQTSKSVTHITGDHYAVAIVRVDSDGEPNYSGTPTSEGTVTIVNGAITFTPSSEFPSHKTATGTISGNSVTMATVPGGPTSLKNINLSFRSDVNASPTAPFGKNGSAISIPGGGGNDNNGGGGSNNGTDIPAADGDYEPGRIVTKIEILDANKPNWQVETKAAVGTASAEYKKYYEGDIISQADITLTKMQVVLTLNDGSKNVIPANQILTYFIIDPPDYRPSSASSTSSNCCQHTLYYKGGYGNSRGGFTNDKTATQTDMKANFSGPASTYLITIGTLSSVTPATETATKLISPASIDNWHEDAQTFYPNNGRVEVFYTSPNDRNTTLTKDDSGDVKTRKAWTVNITKDYKAKYDNSSGKVKVEFGSQSNHLEIPANLAYITDVTISQPEFKQQILYDDPRLFVEKESSGGGGGSGSSTTDDTPAVHLHWLNKLDGARVSVTYTGNQKSEMSIVEAYNNAAYYDDGSKKAVSATGFLNTPEAPFKTQLGGIGFSYWSFNRAMTIPVYNALTKITVVGSPNVVPILYTELPGGLKANEQFMQNVLVYAEYEYGKKGPTVLRKDTYAQSRENTTTNPNPNQSSIGKFEPEAVSDELLKTAYDSWSKQKTTAVTVSFKTKGVGTGDDGWTVKTAKIQIGAIDYK